MKKAKKLNRMSQINPGAFNFTLTGAVARRSVRLAHIPKIGPTHRINY